MNIRIPDESGTATAAVGTCGGYLQGSGEDREKTDCVLFHDCNLYLKLEVGKSARVVCFSLHRMASALIQECIAAPCLLL